MSLDGRTVLQATVRDITARKKAEAALRESELRHRSILETAMDGFWLVDMQGRLLDVNEAYCQMSGYSQQELLGMSVSQLQAVSTPAEVTACMRQVAAQGEARFETLHRRKNGRDFCVEASAQHRSADGGQCVLFLHDITERKRAEETLTQTNQTLLAEIADATEDSGRAGRGARRGSRGHAGSRPSSWRT